MLGSRDVVRLSDLATLPPAIFHSSQHKRETLAYVEGTTENRVSN